MTILEDFLKTQRKSLASYVAGLSAASSFVNENQGKIINLGDGETKLVLGDEEATCFQPYQDIDLFYFEI